MTGEGLHPVTVYGRDLAAEAAGFFRKPGKVRCTLKDLCSGLGQRLAFFKGEQPCQVFNVLGNGAFPGVEQSAPFQGRSCAPDSKGRLRGQVNTEELRA